MFGVEMKSMQPSSPQELEDEQAGKQLDEHNLARLGKKSVLKVLSFLKMRSITKLVSEISAFCLFSASVVRFSSLGRDSLCKLS